MANAVIRVTMDTSETERKLRIVAKHLTALADELQHGEASAEPLPFADPGTVIVPREWTTIGHGLDAALSAYGGENDTAWASIRIRRSQP